MLLRTLIIIVTVAILSALPAAQIPDGKMNKDIPERVIRIDIRKQARTLKVFKGPELLKTYRIVLGFAPIGDKEVEGDGKTPEGSFYIFTKNAGSKFHLSLGLSYPSIDDAERGVDANLISKEEADSIVRSINEKGMPLQRTRLGGEIYIHGGGVDRDWTDGCIALKDNVIEELFDLVPVGAIVEIFP